MEGKNVHIVEMRDRLAPDANIRHRTSALFLVEQTACFFIFGFKAKISTQQCRFTNLTAFQNVFALVYGREKSAP
jgi:hypothetical protein